MKKIPSTMKAANLHGIGDLRCEDLPVPVPQKDEVLLRVLAAGICGSDIPRVFEKGTYHFPTVPGHEFSGVIVADGDDDTPSAVSGSFSRKDAKTDGDLREFASGNCCGQAPVYSNTPSAVSGSFSRKDAQIGRRAAVFPLIPCGKCSACQTGNYAQCEDYDYYGSRRDGGFAEYIAVKKWNLVFVPDGVSDESAAMCEPCAVAIHALREAGIEIGDTVAIFGAGTIGLLAAQVARGWGAANIVLADVDDAKLSFARSLGFENTVNTLKEDAVQYIKKISGGRGADVALEAAGVSATLELCLNSARSFGRVVLMGNPAKNMEIPQKSYWNILRGQLKLFGTWNSSYNDAVNDWRLALSCMEKGIFNLAPLITHRFKLEDCKAAFELAKNRKEFYVKILITGETCKTSVLQVQPIKNAYFARL